MGKKKWGRMFAMAMATALTVTSVPFSAHATEGEEGSPAGAETGTTDDGYQLVFEDDFDGDTLDTSAWNVEEHESGWVNKEKQRYTSLDEGNIQVDDGMLHIISKYDAPEEDNEGEEETSEETQSEEVYTAVVAETKEYSFDFNMGGDAEQVDTIALQINFGKIGQDEAGSTAATVTLSDISLMDVTDDENPVEVLTDSSSWIAGVTAPAEGSVNNEDGKITVKVENSGEQNWQIQLQQQNLTLISGHTYKFSMKASSDVDRLTEISILDPVHDYAWYGGSTILIERSGSSEGTGNQSGKIGEVTSGRITTQNKYDFTYGRFEARAKVPTGKGLLPAFWLMATDEGLYGQWPRCGEIDIMEVMGQAVNTSYHTIHYGYDSTTGHKENQGTKVLEGDSFADEFHVFRADWEPGRITWYVDDVEVYTTNDWFTGTDDDNQVTYPAPFDQNFYIILNLAVGGSWVGYPDNDDYTTIDGKEFLVDYVKVYQKDENAYKEAEENATRPEKEPVTFREPVDGNYILNGNFKEGISATETKDNWTLHLEKDATGSTATVEGSAVKITPAVVGGQNHSVQLKQIGVPMYKGWEYELSFDACADEDRDIIVDIEGPDHGWTRYFKDTTVKLSTEMQTYSYTFTMEEKTDANGSLEFNLGKLGSTAPVTITNVKLTHKSGEEIADENLKDIRPDGNYVYNGSFDQGDKRLGYWEFDEEDAPQITVTNVKNQRELQVKVEVPEDASEANPVTISQSDLAPIVRGLYEVSFDAYTTDGEADGLTVNVVGEEYTPELTDVSKSYSKVIEVENDLNREESNIEFSFTKPGTYYLDNVFFSEKAILKNGSFNAGLAGFTPYINEAVNATYVIDSMNGNDNAFAITIDDTVAPDAGNDWYVQLNQDGLTIEEGKYYYISLKAKSSIERTIKYSLQQFEGNWTNYSGTGEIEIGTEWKEFSHAFHMTNPTDTNTRFNVTMGSVGGTRITDKHDVFIDDIQLYELTKEEYDKLTGSETGNTPSGDDEPTTDPEETPDTPAPQPGTSEDTPVTDPENTPDTPVVQPETSEEATEVPVVTPDTPTVNTGDTQTEPSTAQTPEVKTPETQAPVVDTVKTEEPKVKVESKVNNNGKADRGETKVTKTALYRVVSKKIVSFAANAETLKKSYTVPATVKIDKAKVKVTKIAKNAFKDNTKLTKVTLGKNITSIAKEAFSGCTGLKKITVKSDSLKSVNKKAFKGCKLDKNFKVVIHASDEANFNRIVDLFRKAGLTDVTFVYKK